MKRFTKHIGVLLALMIGLAIGFIVGRSQTENMPIKTRKITTWARGETIIKEIPIPKPYAIHDTTYVIKEVPVEIDTASLFKVWYDYYLTRNYELDFSNDSLGIFKVKIDVHQNKIATAPNAVIQPNILTITEESTIIKKPFIQGYVMIGTSVNLSTNQIQAGVDLKQRYLIGISGIRMKNNYGYTINAGIKF